MNTTVKYLKDLSPFQIVFFRSAGSLFFTFGYLFKNKIPIIGKHNKLLISRSLTGVTSMTLFFMSIKYLPIGTAVSLRYTAPIFAAVLAIIFLKEKIKPIQWLFFIVAFSGVLIIKGFDSSLNTYGLILVLLAAFTSGIVFIIINKIGNREHPVVVVNYFMVTATIVGGVLSINNWVNPIGEQWFLLMLLGVFGYYGQVFMTKAFQTASTNLIAPLKYIEVVFTLIISLYLFNETHTIWSILGIFLIIGSLVLNTLYKANLSKQKSN